MSQSQFLGGHPKRRRLVSSPHVDNDERCWRWIGRGGDRVANERLGRLMARGVPDFSSEARYMNMAFLLPWHLIAVLGESFDDPSMDGPVSPMLLMALSTLVCVVLIILALAIAVMVMTALTALGIVSSSVLMGVFRRRWSTALRAFHYQLFAVLGVLCGAGLTWGVARLSHLQASAREVLAVGAVAGLCSGTLMAFALDRLVCMMHRRHFAARPPDDR